MARQVITMWELYGSGMEDIAAAVAARLGLPVHGQAFSSEAVEAEVARREQEGTFGRWLARLTPAPAPGGDDRAAMVIDGMTMEDTARQVRADVNAFADEGGIILGRNGAFLLRGRPGSLHVKLTGDTDARVSHAAQASGISPERAAKRQIIEDDFRRDLAIKIFRFDPVGDDYYDLVIDTSRFTQEQAVELIVAAAQARSVAG